MQGSVVFANEIVRTFEMLTYVETVENPVTSISVPVAYLDLEIGHRRNNPLHS
jgi:hypothetical protein